MKKLARGEKSAQLMIADDKETTAFLTIVPESEKSYLNRNDIAYKVKALSGDFIEPMDNCLNLMSNDRPTAY